MFIHMRSSTTYFSLVSFFENLQDLNISIWPNMHTVPYFKPLSFSKLTCLNVSDGRQYDAVRYSKHDVLASDTVLCLRVFQTVFQKPDLVSIQ